MLRLLKPVFCLLLLCLSFSPATAASFKIVAENPANAPLGGFPAREANRDLWIELSGTIEAGDTARLGELIQTETGGGSSPANIRLLLHSDGGSFAEALKLADAFTLTTIVGKGRRCYSACGVIFMAGRIKDGEPDRHFHAQGRLGFHAPFLPIIRGQFTRKTLSNAHIVGMRVSVDLLSRQKQFSLPTVWIDLMLSKGPKEFAEMDYIHHAVEFEIPVFGLPVPSIPKKQMLQHLCLNIVDDQHHDGWPFDKYDRNGRVKAKVFEESRTYFQTYSLAEKIKITSQAATIFASLNEMTGLECNGRIEFTNGAVSKVWRKTRQNFIWSDMSGVFLLYFPWTQLSGRLGNTPRRSTADRSRCGWYAISYCSRQESEAESAAQRYGGEVVATDDPSYPNFSPGWFCSMEGPSGKRTARSLARRARRRGARTAYFKKSC